MFQLTLEERKAVLLSRPQIVTLKRGQNIKYSPYVFTEPRGTPENRPMRDTSKPANER